MKIYIDHNKKIDHSPCYDCETGGGSISSGRDEKGEYTETTTCHDDCIKLKSYYMNIKEDSSIYCNTLHIPKRYKIDFDKVTNLEDILLILKSLNITISEESIIGIEHLVKEITY